MNAFSDIQAVPGKMPRRPWNAEAQKRAMQADFERLGITGRKPQQDAHVRLKQAHDDADRALMGLIGGIL
jgi:hypothetical protein